MPKTKPEEPHVNYVIRAHVEHITPPIWRVVEIPGSCTLEMLHRVLQVLFGWDDDHMHEFQVQKSYASPAAESRRGSWFAQENERVSLDRLFKRRRARFRYLYDFGDNWLVQLKIEKTAPAGSSPGRARCLSGERAGPVEDSGGPYGYWQLLELRQKKGRKTADELEMLEWLGDDFDPEQFSIETVNRQLRTLRMPDPGSAADDLTDAAECVWGGVTVEVDLPGVPSVAEEGPAARPVLALWFDITDDRWLTDEDAPLPELVAAHAGSSADDPPGLLQAFQSPLRRQDDSMPCRPTQIVAATLEDLLILRQAQPRGVTVQPAMMPELRDLAEQLAPEFVGMALQMFELDLATVSPVPGKPGIDERFAREWLRAVRTFYEAKAWESFTDDHLVKVSGEGIPGHFAFCLGGDDLTAGILCLEKPEHVEQFLIAMQENDGPEENDQEVHLPPSLSVTYHSREEAPPVLEEHVDGLALEWKRLPVLPSAQKSIGVKGSPGTLNAREFALLAAVAESLGALSAGFHRTGKQPQSGMRYPVNVQWLGRTQEVVIELMNLSEFQSVDDGHEKG